MSEYKDYNDNLKDFKELIKVADVYGKEARDINEAWYNDVYDYIKKSLGIGDAEAKPIADAAKKAAEKAKAVNKKTG